MAKNFDWWYAGAIAWPSWPVRDNAVSTLSEWTIDLPPDVLEPAEPSIECNGKGDTPRPVEREAFEPNFETVFGEKPKHVCRKFVKMGNRRCCYFCGEPEETPF